MKKLISTLVFRKFNWEKLSENEQSVLRGGEKKHTSIMWWAAPFLPFQAALAIVSPNIFVVVSAVSFITLLLGGAWYTISFQNVSADQLDAGVADFITKKMFRALALSMAMLFLGVIMFIARSLFPELPFPEKVDDIHIVWRGLVFTSNLFWILVVWADIYLASVAYDAADSLLGDGFPTMMRGANASANLLPLLEKLDELVRIQKGET